MMNKLRLIPALLLLMLTLAACGGGDSLSRYAIDHSDEALQLFKDEVGTRNTVTSVRWLAIDLKVDNPSEGIYMDVRTVYYYIDYERDGDAGAVVVQYIVGEDSQATHEEWDIVSAYWYGSYDQLRGGYLDTFVREEAPDGFEAFEFTYREGELSERDIDRHMSD